MFTKTLTGSSPYFFSLFEPAGVTNHRRFRISQQFHVAVSSANLSFQAVCDSVLSNILKRPSGCLSSVYSSAMKITAISTSSCLDSSFAFLPRLAPQQGLQERRADHLPVHLVDVCRDTVATVKRIGSRRRGLVFRETLL